MKKQIPMKKEQARLAYTVAVADDDAEKVT